MLTMLSKNVGVHHFEALPILPDCISPISAVLILRMADFIFFMNGVTAMKRLHASHGFDCNMSAFLDCQKMNVIQRLSNVPESVM